MAADTEMVRVHLALPAKLIEELDARAGKRRRSEFVAEILTKELQRQRRAELARKMAGALANKHIPGWETSESTAEWISELRQRSDRYDAFGNPIER
jgi:metal-responsive CopG/Arc/MetJ family transcriptional regulator